METILLKDGGMQMVKLQYEGHNEILSTSRKRNLSLTGIRSELVQERMAR